jgi:hypothetical protein
MFKGRNRVVFCTWLYIQSVEVMPLLKVKGFQDDSKTRAVNFSSAPCVYCSRYPIMGSYGSKNIQLRPPSRAGNREGNLSHSVSCWVLFSATPINIEERLCEIVPFLELMFSSVIWGTRTASSSSCSEAIRNYSDKILDLEVLHEQCPRCHLFVGIVMNFIFPVGVGPTEIFCRTSTPQCFLGLANEHP